MFKGLNMIALGKTERTLGRGNSMEEVQSLKKALNVWETVWLNGRARAQWIRWGVESVGTLGGEPSSLLGRSGK